MKFTGWLGTERMLVGELTLAPDAKLTTENGEVIGTVESIELVNGDYMVNATVTDERVERILRGDRS